MPPERTAKSTWQPLPTPFYTFQKKTHRSARRDLALARGATAKARARILNDQDQNLRHRVGRHRGQSRGSGSDDDAVEDHDGIKDKVGRWNTTRLKPRAGLILAAMNGAGRNFDHSRNGS
jgi:hypothetical protein